MTRSNLSHPKQFDLIHTRIQHKNNKIKPEPSRAEPNQKLEVVNKLQTQQKPSNPIQSKAKQSKTRKKQQSSHADVRSHCQATRRYRAYEDHESSWPTKFMNESTKQASNNSQQKHSKPRKLNIHHCDRISPIFPETNLWMNEFTTNRILTMSFRNTHSVIHWLTDWLFPNQWSWRSNQPILPTYYVTKRNIRVSFKEGVKYLMKLCQFFWFRLQHLQVHICKWLLVFLLCVKSDTSASSKYWRLQICFSTTIRKTHTQTWGDLEKMVKLLSNNQTFRTHTHTDKNKNKQAKRTQRYTHQSGSFGKRQNVESAIEQLVFFFTLLFGDLDYPDFLTWKK